MGTVFGEVLFDGQTPALPRITERVRGISNLELSVSESGSDVKAHLFDLHAYLAFACEPKGQLKLYGYHPGVVKEFYQQTFGDTVLPIARCVKGLNESPGKQTVYLQALDDEPTLLFVTLLALESLGGCPREPISEDERRKYGTPVTASQLHARRRKARVRALKTTLVVVLLLPVLIPVWLLWFVLMVVIMPWGTWKAYRMCRTQW
jgi:hypothetical protein